jgi:hypothetical protein
MSRPRTSGFVEPSYPELVALDQQPRRRRPKGVPKSLNGLSAELAALVEMATREACDRYSLNSGAKADIRN